MMRVLVVWEDLYFEPLALFLKRRLSHLIPTPNPPFPTLLFHTTKGQGAFSRYVQSTWPNARGKGLPR